MPSLCVIMAANTAGRTPKYAEKLSERIVVYVTPSQLEQLKERAPGGDISSFARERLASGGPENQEADTPEAFGIDDPALTGTDQFRGPLLGPVPCGPWREAIEEASSFTLSRDTADFLEVRPGDLFLPAQGQSMEGAGIQDGFLVVVRPLDGKIPRRREIVLVAVTSEDGDTQFTLKHWEPAGTPGGTPGLVDGDGNPVPFPEGTVQVQPMARAIALLGRL